MDVSDSTENETEAGGQELVDKLVSLTGLPKTLVYKELDSILANTGQEVNDLTLETLRSAMLLYLESIHSDFVASEESNKGKIVSN
ncbi:MAG: hypothetical protein AABZ06_08810 [Bdellovibrionota bacterium]